MDYKAFTLTFIQYTTLLLMLWRMNWLCSNLELKLLQLLGFFVVIWAVFEMRKSKLNITPSPKKGASLINSGIYKVLRHPMYTSLLLTFTPMIIENYNLVNFLIFITFTLNLILKLEYEEVLLKRFFKNYAIYQTKSWRIIPFIY